MNNAPLEKQTQRTILDYLELKRIFCWKHHNVGIKKPNGHYIPTSLLGISDILGVLPDGKFLAIEVKRKGGVVSDKQTEFLYNIERNDGVGFVAYDVDDVINNLKKYGY